MRGRNRFQTAGFLVKSANDLLTCSAGSVQSAMKSEDTHLSKP